MKAQILLYSYQQALIVMEWLYNFFLALLESAQEFEQSNI